MSKNCRHNNLLQRDGTSQQQRLLQALLPGYVAVDDRKIEDLKTFALDYARQIQYYDPGNNEKGDWHSFFDKQLDPDQRTEPHYALFLAFLQLFKIAQDDLNQITQRHLDFYYRQVLQLEEKAAEPDQVFIIFKLAKHVNQHQVAKGTQLKAGKDASGKDLIYETRADIVVNPATVEELKAVFKSPNSRLYASPKANSADGEGAEIETVTMSWKTFGKPASDPVDRTQAEIGFAFASPVLFLAEGDREITLTLSLKEMPGIAALLTGLDLQNAFRVRFSGEEEWIEPLMEESEVVAGTEVPPAVEERVLDFLNSATTWVDIAGIESQYGPIYDDPAHGYGDQYQDYDIGETTANEILAERSRLGAAGFTSLAQVRSVRGVGEDKINDLVYSFRDPANSTIVDIPNRQIIIKRTITKAQEAIVAYNKEALIDPFKTSWPVVKITLDTAQDPYVYNILSQLKIDSAQIMVNVCEIKELVIQNDQSLLDAGSDFQPFGIRPVIGSNFYVGSREVFSKRLDKLKINVLWHGLPSDDKGFGDYYKNYTVDTLNNQSFKANLYILDKKSWVDLETSQGAGEARSLFASPDDTALDPSRSIVVENVAGLESVERDEKLEEFDSYDTYSKKGFVKLELTGADFGHKDFQESFTTQVLAKVDDPTNATITLPNEPYTPQIKEIYINYRSSVELDLLAGVPARDYDDRIEQFFQVGAFGVTEPVTLELTTGDLDIPLFHQYINEGELYIGLADFTPGQNISLLFQVAEGSADPDLGQQPLVWSYLASNEWVDFDKFDILSDGTTGLLSSGIVRLAIPKNATKNNTLLPAGLHWIRVAVARDSDAVPSLVDVQTQAVTAVFKDRDNDPNHLRQALPEGTISKLKVADSSINSLSQPFASFGGKVTEQSNAFYTRVSERLRHKNRAITLWDYERLVLGQFASAYKVKCLNHTRYTGSLTGYSEIAPGHVTLVVISNVRNKNAIDPLRPKTSLATLVNIHDFLVKLNPACIELHVKNPIYEEIQVKTNVKFYIGFDNGFYTKQLEDDIKAFLSPWAFEGTPDLVFGGRVHKSIILNYIEELPYVDYVTCFEMYHIVKNPSTDAIISINSVDEAVATTAVSILGSVGQVGNYGDHVITALETDDCECEDNEILPTASIASADDCPCDEDQMFDM